MHTPQQPAGVQVPGQARLPQGHSAHCWSPHHPHRGSLQVTRNALGKALTCLAILKIFKEAGLTEAHFLLTGPSVI